MSRYGTRLHAVPMKTGSNTQDTINDERHQNIPPLSSLPFRPPADGLRPPPLGELVPVPVVITSVGVVTGRLSYGGRGGGDPSFELAE